MTQRSGEIAAEKTAAEIGQHLKKADRRFLDLLGISVDSVTPSEAVCSLTVREDMLNSGQFCHGGFIFFLADTAFAYACLSSNQAMVTLSAHIAFTHAAKLGARLTATAQIVTQSGRTGTGSVEVVNQHDDIVARFDGVSYRRKEQLLDASRTPLT